ncbi:MAG: HAD-IA family hydrolase [Actinomycetota bacterium]|nr:HAD-IA family hydrolase [Actinomycetota bacterium]
MALRALLIDALGTTVRLLSPWERIDPALVIGLAPERVEAAFRVEMSHYAAHAHEAVDDDALAGLRAECAALLSRELGRAVGVEAMMDAIAFEAYRDARPALEEIGALGLRRVCVSNWDYALDDVLARVGLADGFDAVLTSAAAGARKPDPAIFARALALVGCGAEEAIHVGDSDDDVDGARAAGIEVLRIDRDGPGADLASLAELAPRLAVMQPNGAIGEHPR